jgi:hypothetical protein
MSEDIIQVKFTPNGKYYLVSLLDFHINMYFADSDK